MNIGVLEISELQTFQYLNFKVHEKVKFALFGGCRYWPFDPMHQKNRIFQKKKIWTSLRRLLQDQTGNFLIGHPPLCDPDASFDFWGFVHIWSHPKSSTQIWWYPF